MATKTTNTTEELVSKLKSAREALRDFRLSRSGGKAKNMKEGSNQKRAIARIMTELNGQVNTVAK